MNEIPADLIISLDQTGLTFVPVSESMMEVQGAKIVEVVGEEDAWLVTGCRFLATSGDISGKESLPPQVIYQGKSPSCFLHFEFLEKWHITFSINHWSNESTIMEYIQHILLPYINEKRKNLKLSNDHPALVICNNFKGLCTPDILIFLDQKNINVILIPNCTDHLQPLGHSVNKAVKDQLHSQYQAHYAQEVAINFKNTSPQT